MTRWILCTVFFAAAAWAQDGDYYFKTKVKDARDSTAVYLKLAADRTKIEGQGGLVLKARNPTADKHRYNDGADSTRLQVVVKEEGFKLYDAAGGLLWKVKFTADKIKIADNEENADPCELKLGADKAKVVYRGKELGSAKFYVDKVKVKDVENRMLYSAKTLSMSASYGLLLCGHIPARERYVLMAEILRASR